MNIFIACYDTEQGSHSQPWPRKAFMDKIGAEKFLSETYKIPIELVGKAGTFSDIYEIPLEENYSTSIFGVL